MYKQYDVIKTVKPITQVCSIEGAEVSVPIDSIGTIVEILSNTHSTAYLVEFMDDNGYTTALVDLILGDFIHSELNDLRA